MLTASRASADRTSTNNITIDPEITKNSNTQDEAYRQNVLRLATIGVKERIA